MKADRLQEDRDGEAGSARAEIESGERFAFGENWRAFLASLDDSRIATAEASLRERLEVSDLRGRSFIDIGSGSGLFSLAARRLGARVHSLDFDPASVACAEELRRRYFPGDPDWSIEQASALDGEHLRSLGRFDVVYSWGVLHHTGDMWRALELVVPLVAPGGRLFIALYNDQGRMSRIWLSIKRFYCRLPSALRPLLLVAVAARIWGPRLVLDALRLDPLRTWRSYSRKRGMSPWRDVVDWVGGYPFEVARPDQVFHFFRARGFALQRLATVAGAHGNNEFVFERIADDSPGGTA
jgi:2-polyprenyl-6-hydroxyphenyl methylase/3-demethylubiquinone-9 3-methyltransferase